MVCDLSQIPRVTYQTDLKWEAFLKSAGRSLSQRLTLPPKIRMTPKRMNNNPIVSSRVDLVFPFAHYVPSVMSFHRVNISYRNEALDRTGSRPHARTGR